MEKLTDYNLQILLTQKEIQVINYRWGALLTLDQVAEKLGVTRERIRQVESKVGMKLMDAIENTIKNKEKEYVTPEIRKK